MTTLDQLIRSLIVYRKHNGYSKRIELDRHGYQYARAFEPHHCSSCGQYMANRKDVCPCDIPF